MKRFSSIAGMMLMGSLWASRLHAQTPAGQPPFSLENDYRNIFSQQASSDWPPVAPVVNGVQPTAHQWENGSAFGGFVEGGASGPNDPPPANIEAGPGVQLVSVKIGRPLVLAPISYLFGGVISPPLFQPNGDPAPAGFYLAEPTHNYNGVPDQFYWSPAAGKVYATQQGTITIAWKATVSGELNPQTYQVASAPDKPARKIYWTENGFNGPVVQVPESRVNGVNIVYNAQFPQTVPTAYALPPTIPGTTQLSPELRTLWYDSTERFIRAYNAEGRLFLEYLGNLKADGTTREQIGYEIVEVIKEVRPATLQVDLGDVVGPQDSDTNLSAVIIAGLGLSTKPYLYENITQGGTRHTLYAIRATAPGVLVDGVEQQVGNEVLIYWEEAGVLGIAWPKYYDGYVLSWPAVDSSNYSFYARPGLGNSDAQATGVPLSSLDNPTLVYQSDPSNQQAVMLPGNIFYTILTSQNPDGMALIRYTNGDDIWFERIYFQPDTGAHLNDGTTLPADIGKRIQPPVADLDADPMVGYIRQQAGNAFDAEAYLDPFVVGFEQARHGAIIPVNNLPGNNTLEVWWFKKSKPPGSRINGTYWPQFVNRYAINWPTDAGEIVLASNLGSGDLPNSERSGHIYYQNDSTKPGFNPNEEHALMLNGRAWALRDDLNVPTSSEPYVLVSYTDDVGQRPAMAVFKVLREEPNADPAINYTFNYPGTAGVILQAPMPLPLLPIPRCSDPSQANYVVRCSDPSQTKDITPYNYEVEPAVPPDAAVNFDPADHADDAYARYQKFTYIDRKATHWIYRGPHGIPANNPAPTFSMRYYYQTQQGFYFPGVNPQPAAGTVVPYLRPYNNPADPAAGFAGDPVTGGVTGTPLNIVFTPRWPAAVPQLLVSQTLTLPTQGLPAIRGQSSAKIIYQQSIAKNVGAKVQSAKLYDPTRAKTYPIGVDGLPKSINTFVYLGKTYFPNLPPHLSQRLYFDPTIGATGALVLIGQFQDDPVGDKYLSLNILSAADVEAAIGLCDPNDNSKGAWDTAIGSLSTVMQTFKENPNKRGTFIVDPTKDVTIGVSALSEVTDDMTAVDSYALAANGGGEGYVVLATGDSRDTDFTPAGEPVALQVLQVASPLNRGQLKVVAPSNPLDEKLTLQHSGDFAGHPEDYDFEWRYQPPDANGSAPSVYDVGSSALVPSESDPNWNVFHNPGADYAKYRGNDADVTGSSLLGMPQLGFVINDGNGTAANGTTLPYALLRHQFTFGGPDRPLRLFVSLDLGSLDAAIVYVNGARVAVWNVAATPSTGRTAAPPTNAFGNPLFSPLPYLFEIPPVVLLNGANTLTVELYTNADPKSASTVDAHLDSVQGVDNVETNGSWIALAAAPPGETAGSKGISVVGRPRYVIEGSSLLTLTDNYYTMRYRANKPGSATYDNATGGWSKWTEPQLAEGWIKRALGGINPFQQRTTDLFNNTVDTEVSLVEQAGKRWEGDIALNLQNINDFGLIEIYETILRRGESLSINGNPPINYGGANDALLLVAGYLSDLYNILGNEAFADAADPTIAVGTSDNTFGNVATSLFAFKGEVSSLAEEELDLLRGRDDFLQPGTRTAPVYNRLYWNYTRGIDSGEAIYALNYNIKDLSKDGVISATDAAVAYPQGHGDAYGHYLTALTGYYGLLTNSNFSWTPRSEAVLVLGVPVQVDYLDERKFASTSANLARTASQVLDLTYRQAYSATDTPTWTKLRDGKRNNATGRVRSWGVDEWAARGGQGAYFNWIVGNSLLPAVDPNPTHQGIQIIDRTTVPELAEVVAQGNAIQKTLENADAGLNPLGLGKSAFAFDISPSEVDQGKTHYEQIYERAVAALQNAVTASNNAVGSTLALRSQEDNVDTERQAIDQQEQVFTNELVELYGTPYSDDIGPGRTYTQGYSGPDLLHSLYIDMPELFVGPLTGETTYTLELDPQFNADNPGVLDSHGTVSYTFNGFGDNAKPASWSGHRATPGRMQTAVSDLFLARQNLQQNLSDYSKLVTAFKQQTDLYQSTVDTRNANLENSASTELKVTILRTVNAAEDAAVRALTALQSSTQDGARAVVEFLPKVNGIDNDATSGGRGAALAAAAVQRKIYLAYSIALQAEVAVNNAAINKLNSDLAKAIEAANWENENKQLIYGLQTSLAQMVNQQRGVDAALRRLDQASRDLSALQGEGDRIQQERQTYRQRAAAIIQGYRVKDFAFRAFRNEALEKYKTLFDLASRYTYLAARAYDYETGLLNANGNSTAAKFFEGIIQSRALGVVSNGQPQFAGSSTGDPGLSGILASMSSDWSVAKTRLGFNNPDRYRTTFSLRNEKLRLTDDPSGNQAWKDMLASCTVSNILDDPDVKRYALQPGNPAALTQPGIIIPFETSIRAGYNFFGQPLAGGDHTFTPSSFATKIRSTGIAFKGYVGMDSPTTTSSTLTSLGATSPTDPSTAFTDSNALSATPYVYLIPAGVDEMLAPPVSGVSTVRSWTVEDQAIPLPFNIGGTDFALDPGFVSSDSLSEPEVTLRKQEAFRAVPDGTAFPSDPGFTNSRLIGRSVWNTRWKLVIPGDTLLADPQKGIQTFNNTVTDIKLHLETYSYSGN